MLEMKWFMGDKDNLSDTHAIRRAVFIEEQGVSEAEEMDDTDSACIHLVLYDGDEPISTGRIMITDEDYIIGRVATIKSRRGQGLATGVMQSLVGACVTMGGMRQILHAQVQARPFYEKLGFVAHGDIFDEAGIPHIAMEHFGGMKTCGSGGHCGGCGKGHH